MYRLRQTIKISIINLITHIYITFLAILECRSNQVTPRGITFIISISDNATNKHLCIGTYVKLYWVMTNAVCAEKAQTSGDPILIASDVVRNHDGQARRPKHYAIHPNYDKDAMVNNIGLIELWDPFILGRDIEWILFPTASSKYGSCTLIGWKFLNKSKPYQYLVVMSVRVKRLEDEDCTHFITEEDTPYRYVNSEMLCVWDALCLSEEGAPLVCDGKLFGIMSYTTCTVTIIESIEHHRRWIDMLTATITTKVLDRDIPPDTSKSDSTPVLSYAAIAGYLVANIYGKS